MTEGIAYDFVWDGENRLIKATPKNPVDMDYKMVCTYDYLGRRVSKFTKIWYGGGWYNGAQINDKYFYEGWNLVYSEGDPWGGSHKDSYTWGIDLSGSLQRAGGVGGLLAVEHNDTGTSRHYWYQYDGNGNVTEMMDIAGAVYMHYEYDPFGRITNPPAGWHNGFWNPFTFSTKYMDRLQYYELNAAPGTEFKEPLYYYGYRHYSPELGRWLSRDPIGEGGGENLFAFVENNPTRKIDLLGWVAITWSRKRGGFSQREKKILKSSLKSAISNAARFGPDAKKYRNVFRKLMLSVSRLLL